MADVIGALALSPAPVPVPRSPDSWPERLELVSTALHAAGMTDKTISLYCGVISRAERHFADRGSSLLEARSEGLVAFAETQGKSHATRRTMRCAFGHYFEILGRPDAPLKALHATAPATAPLPAPEEILSAAARAGGAKGLAVALMAGTGLTAAEVAALRYDQLGTGEILLHPTAATLAGELTGSSPWLFPSGSGSGHVDKQTVSGWAYELCREAGLPLLRPERLRAVAGISDAKKADRPALRVIRGRGGKVAVDEAPPWAERLGVLRAYLMGEGFSPKTVRTYVATAARAERHFAARGQDLPAADAPELAEYAAVLPQTRSTLAMVRHALRHYFASLGRLDAPLKVIRVPRKPRMVCRALEDGEAEALVEAALAWDGPAGLAVLFGLFMALRRDEISRVRFDDVDEEGWLRVMGKGDLPARLPLHPIVAAALAGHPVSGEWVFPGADGAGHVSDATIWNYVRRVAAAAGVEGVQTHRLRHTCLATANDRTGDLRAVQEFARHARPETTAGYTRATRTRLLAVVGSVHYGAEG